MEQTTTTASLSRCEFFKGIEMEHLAEVSALCSHETRKAGERIFQQGEICDLLYIICEGQVTLDRASDLGKRKGRVTLARLGRGSAFGAWSVLLGDEHRLMTSAMCKTDSELVVVEGKKLRDLMHRRGDLGFRIMERLCSQLMSRLTTVIDVMEKI